MSQTSAPHGFKAVNSLQGKQCLHILFVLLLMFPGSNVGEGDLRPPTPVFLIRLLKRDNASQ